MESSTTTTADSQESSPLPNVLLMKTPPAFTLIGEQPFTSTKFHYLKAYESPLPLHEFLTLHSPSIRAILSSGSAAVNAGILQFLPSVGVVVTTSAGLNQIDIPECRRRGIAIANTGDVYSADVADLAVALLIDVLRNISACDRYTKQGLWSSKGEYPLGHKLSGKRIGIVGLGSIGYEVAKRLEAFGCYISYNSRKRKPYVSYTFYSNVCELAADCDALIICCGLTDQTFHMIDKEVLLALGKNGVIVNIGRGSIIDEKELVRCLVEGEIAGAGLDVFEHEPLVPRELVSMDNVVLSPHVAVLTPESMKQLSELVVGNLEAFFEKKPLLSEYLDD
ncbi:glyoxylate/hydroxypyruvate reductase HPR3 [Mercurialis annua]|uniref:glyoxylate/hydroxypyruvate reductase HPR3 n=1 Tax=Mercurialis annua TaxID=3986 RepID=UPI00215E67D6|nr:glyoxylate/hydroxypyruvate reductase HPR3 [Mercurialis annua]XP_050236874.1 glyoxylate/hydroxypyruvate reductase HPR3 [Mercurialis annua]